MKGTVAGRKVSVLELSGNESKHYWNSSFPVYSSPHSGRIYYAVSEWITSLSNRQCWAPVNFQWLNNFISQKINTCTRFCNRCFFPNEQRGREKGTGRETEQKIGVRNAMHRHCKINMHKRNEIFPTRSSTSHRTSLTTLRKASSGIMKEIEEIASIIWKLF